MVDINFEMGWNGFFIEGVGVSNFWVVAALSHSYSNRYAYSEEKCSLPEESKAIGDTVGDVHLHAQGAINCIGIPGDSKT